MTVSDIAERLRAVVDPDLGLDVVSLGLVYDIEETDRAIRVALAMTSAECPMASVIVEAAADAIGEAYRGRAVEVSVVDDPPWSPEMLSAAGRRKLGLR